MGNCMILVLTLSHHVCLLNIHMLKIISLIQFILFVIWLLLLRCCDVQPNLGPQANISRYELRNIGIVNLNVNSLRNKVDLIGAELGNYDVICISESKLNPNIKSSDLFFANFFDPNLFVRKGYLIMVVVYYMFTIV